MLHLKYKEQKEKKREEDEWSEAQLTVAQVRIMKLLEEKTQNVQQRVNTSFYFISEAKTAGKIYFLGKVVCTGTEAHAGKYLVSIGRFILYSTSVCNLFKLINLTE